MAPGHRLRKCRKLPKIADLLDFDLFRFLTSPGGYFQARSFFFGSNGLYWSPEHTREWRRLYFDITHLSEQPNKSYRDVHIFHTFLLSKRLPSVLFFSMKRCLLHVYGKIYAHACLGVTLQGGYLSSLMDVGGTIFLPKRASTLYTCRYSICLSYVDIH